MQTFTGQFYVSKKTFALGSQILFPDVRCRTKIELQDFIKYNISYTRFRARKTVLGVRSCTWGIVNVKDHTYTFLIITYGGRNCNKLVLKPAAINGLSISVMCTAPFL